MKAVRDMVYRVGEEVPEEEREEEVVEVLAREHDLDEQSARDAYAHAETIQSLMAEEIERVVPEAGGIRELLGEAGPMQVRAPEAAKREREEFERRREEAGVAPVKLIKVGEGAWQKPKPKRGSKESQPGVLRKRGKLTANQSVSLFYVEGQEIPTRMYAIVTDYAPNRGDLMIMTPWAWLRKGQYIANAQRILPSPFAMIRAMTAP